MSDRHLPEMKRREYSPGIQLKTADYMTYVKCFVCGKKIRSKERYYDGGWGCRAHVHCVREPCYLYEKREGYYMRTLEEVAEILRKDIEYQEKYYSVIVDGNTHHLPKSIITKKETITLKKCKQICEKVESTFSISVEKIVILMTQFDYSSMTPEDYELVLSNDIGVPIIGREKKAVYHHKKNVLRIWEDGLPVYENYDGQICRDVNALADCLL